MDETTGQNRFQAFVDERSKILEDIKQFLNAVLLHCLNMEDIWGFQPHIIATKNVYSLIESLCLIHGLYGYPAKSNHSSANTDLRVNKNAVRNMVLNEIKEENERDEVITFVHYCKEVEKDEFWEFKFSNGMSSLEDSPREPAHIFLQMVRDLFDGRENISVIGRLVLEGLPDGNWLKPVVWAEHRNKQPENFGVSIGVRPFLRPLYLYIKLSQLRNDHCCYGVKLEHVSAFQSVDRKSLKYATSHNCKSKYKKSKDESKVKVKPPCVSCKIFFNGFNKERETKFNPFGNCAEYDVIRTRNLDYLLEKTGGHWRNFKSACEEHFKAFNELTKKLRTSENLSAKEIMEAYCTDTRNGKVLIYQCDSFLQGYELVAKEWPLRPKIVK